MLCSYPANQNEYSEHSIQIRRLLYHPNKLQLYLLIPSQNTLSYGNKSLNEGRETICLCIGTLLYHNPLLNKQNVKSIVSRRGIV